MSESDESSEELIKEKVAEQLTGEHRFKQFQVFNHNIETGNGGWTLFGLDAEGAIWWYTTQEASDSKEKNKWVKHPMKIEKT